MILIEISNLIKNIDWSIQLILYFYIEFTSLANITLSFLRGVIINKGIFFNILNKNKHWNSKTYKNESS